jgi:hypothetical protein
MRVILKRLLLSIAGGAVFQVLIYLLAVALHLPALALVLLPGWALGFAGRDSDHSSSGNIIGWIVMLGVNNLFYSSAIYFFLWRREVQKEIRINDLDSFVKKPSDESIGKVEI